MASNTLHAFIRFENDNKPNSSAKSQSPFSTGSHNIHDGTEIPVTPKEWATESHPSQSEELDKMPIGAGTRYNGPNLTKPPAVHSLDSSPAWPSYTENAAERIDPQTPNELEMSRPSSPSTSSAVDVVQTFSDPPMNKWRVLCACLIYMSNGMNDSAPGALLPYMEQYYHIGYAIVSLIFISNAVGFILAAFCVQPIDMKIGRGKTFMLCDTVLAVACAIMAIPPPFPVFVVAFFLVGWGQAINLALNNVFGANLARGTVILGVLHGSYGVGGIIAPIIATSLVNRGVLFSRFYLIMVGLRVLSGVLNGWAFWGFEKDMSPPATLLTTPGRRVTQQESAPIRTSAEASRIQQLKQAIKNKTTLIGAVFIFAYQGAEVAISGWVISFLINYRGSNPAKVGYVTAGFWGGITLGRFVLSIPARRIGEKLFTYILVAVAIALQLLVWFVPNVIGNSVAISLVGLVLGPVCPICTAMIARLLPRSLQNTALAFVSSAGSSGGAVAPFLTGLLAQVSGTWVLHPICIALFAVMQACWFCLPAPAKRRE